MAFPINTLIPASGNNPSVDQPGMQTNYANISGFLGIDHTAPGSSAQAGQHNQVHFALNQSTPALNSAVAELFTNLNSGVFGNEATLFLTNAVRSVALSNLVLYNSGTNYGVQTPWGLIINFGSATTSGGSILVSYALPFNSATYAVLATPNSPNIHEASTRATSNTQATLTSDSTSVFYLAIGK